MAWLKTEIFRAQRKTPFPFHKSKRNVPAPATSPFHFHRSALTDSRPQLAGFLPVLTPLSLGWSIILSSSVRSNWHLAPVAPQRRVALQDTPATYPFWRQRLSATFVPSRTRRRCPFFSFFFCPLIILFRCIIQHQDYLTNLQIPYSIQLGMILYAVAYASAVCGSITSAPPIVRFPPRPRWSDVVAGWTQSWVTTSDRPIFSFDGSRHVQRVVASQHKFGG